ncbi:MAG: ABC transporter permease [Maioricimonas sp. JB045]
MSSATAPRPSQTLRGDDPATADATVQNAARLTADGHPIALQVRELIKEYDLAGEPLRVLKGINLEVPEGDYVAIMGPSGSGKSTFLNLLGCLDKPTDGEYWIGTDDVAKLDDDSLAAIRAERIGFVFQAYNLITQLTVLENIATPLAYRGDVTAEDHSRVRELAELVGLGQRLDHRPTQLSGGQQQRAGIARSLINSPQFILADEATGNLDSVTTEEILDLLDKLNAAGVTIVMVTHEEDVAQRTRRIVRLRDGVIESDNRLRPPAVRPEDAPQLQPHGKRSRRWQFGERLQDIKLGFKNLWLHPMRSLLTVLGIFIGVASVIWLLAIGEGISAQAQKQIAELGADNVIIRSRRPPSEQTGGQRILYGLTERDCERLAEAIPNVERAVPVREASGRRFRYGQQSMRGEVIGCTPLYREMNRLEIGRGRFLSDVDVEERKNVCVLSAEVALELFRQNDPIGRSLRIDHDYYRVVGVLRSRENFQGIDGEMKGQRFSDNVYIPLETFWSRISDRDLRGSGGGLAVTQISLKLLDQNEALATGEAVRQFLERTHRFEDYTITVPLELLEQARSTRLMFIALMGMIAAISLVVGGIGIMNIMLATVTERTREIGIRRALGARRNDITRQFLIETIILSTVGGLTGIVGGLACAPLLVAIRDLVQEKFPEMAANMPEAIRDVAPIVVPWSIPLACGIAVMIGVVFGLYPARRAARMNPIDALRHVG